VENLKELQEELMQLKGELSAQWKKKKKENGGERDYDTIREIQDKITDVKEKMNPRKSKSKEAEVE